MTKYSLFFTLFLSTIVLFIFRSAFIAYFDLNPSHIIDYLIIYSFATLTVLFVAVVFRKANSPPLRILVLKLVAVAIFTYFLRYMLLLSLSISDINELVDMFLAVSSSGFLLLGPYATVNFSNIDTSLNINTNSSNIDANIRPSSSSSSSSNSSSSANINLNNPSSSNISSSSDNANPPIVANNANVNMNANVNVNMNANVNANANPNANIIANPPVTGDNTNVNPNSNITAAQWVEGLNTTPFFDMREYADANWSANRQIAQITTENPQIRQQIAENIQGRYNRYEASMHREISPVNPWTLSEEQEQEMMSRITRINGHDVPEYQYHPITNNIVRTETVYRVDPNTGHLIRLYYPGGRAS